jgi:tetratricopeptide (TPR) repeat protein
MNIPIIVIYLAIGGLLQLFRVLTDNFDWVKNVTSKIPYYKTITICITVLLIIAGVLLQIKTEFDKQRYSIFVVPKNITVTPGYSKKAIIKIVNNNDYPVYQIDLKVSVEEGDLPVDSIKLDPKDEAKIKSEIGSDTDKIIISHDQLGIGTINEEGKRENHIIIYDIDAHTTKEYFAEINANNIKSRSKVNFEIVRTATEPSSIVSFDPFVACKKDDNSFKSYHETSKMMLNSKRYNEARICCEKAILKNPKSYKAHNNLGIALLYLNEKDKAISEFEKAIELDPSEISPYLNLAGTLMSDKNFVGAIEKIKAAIAIDSDKKTDLLVLWGRCLYLQGDITGATSKFKQAIDIDTKNGEAHHWWGMALKQNGDCENAIHKFEKSVETEHAFKLDSYGHWGACLEQMGKYDDAMDNYQKIIEIAPDSGAAKLSHESIRLLKEKGNLNEAKD